MPRGRPYYKLSPRETTFDLYTESERLPWYYKALSTFSAWLVLAGYILFSIAYTSSAAELHISPAFIVALACTGVFVGYVSDAALAFLSRSLIFTFDGVLMPVLTASAVGVFSTIVHRALKRETEEGREIYLWLPLIAGAIGTVVSGVFSWVVYRKLRRIKDLDERRRIHIPMHEWSLNGGGNGSVNASSPFIGGGGQMPTVSREVHDMVPDDEQQRHQLMRLLMAKNSANSVRNGSLEDASSTYRIDFPWEDGSNSNRPRSGSLPPSTTGKQPGKFGMSLPFGKGRDRSGTSESFKDPRERRREEIERSGMLASNPSSAGLNPGCHGQGGSPPSRYR